MDEELLSTIRERLSTPTISDVMLTLRFGPHYLPAAIRSLQRGCKLVGRAMPVVMEPGPAAGFGRMLDAVESLQAGDVYVCSAPPGEFALWGELMSHRAGRKGAAGAVISGFHRDSDACEAAGLPLFSAGGYGLSSIDRAHVAGFGCEIGFANGVVVHPGDVIVGDADGVVVIPSGRLREVVEKAIEKANYDVLAADRIRNGYAIPLSN